jgi:phosphoribosylamine--glycine ligase
MKVLVVGSGGREHALAWKIKQSPRLTTLIAAPGNPGMEAIAECVAVKADDVDGLVALAKDRAVDLVVIGPEAPLAAGLADRLAEESIPAFGPSALAARLESSKAFTKDLLARHAIPTAGYGVYTDAAAAKAALDDYAAPYVLKADGLAAGKGVVIAQSREDAEAEIDEFLSGKFGDASTRLVIEEFMEGEEVSVFALCDGQTVTFCGAAQDHKRVGEGDTGLNTGGMGAYSPAPVADEALIADIMTRIIGPTAKAMGAEGCPFKGVLYCGLMITSEGPKVVEYNARFGDPECQVLMTRMASDLLPYLTASAGGELDSMAPIDWRDEPAVTVVMASRGYPESYEKGTAIRAVDAADAQEGVTVFHAGTGRDGHGGLIATGGRVLNITAIGGTLHDAVDRAYLALDKIDWPQGFCRRDIAWRALRRH